MPPAVETRPILDAIGAGAHHVSEIGARLGRPATSMARPLERLTAMGLIRREVPFGESEKKSRRSLYEIDDPFIRLWFRVVAPNREALASGRRAARLQLLRKYWSGLVAEAWEELCRSRLPRLQEGSPVAARGPWGPAARWWRGNEPAWDVVSWSIDRSALLLAEAKWSPRPLRARAVETAASELLARPAPSSLAVPAKLKIVRVLFLPALERGVEKAMAARDDVVVATAGDVLAAAG